MGKFHDYGNGQVAVVSDPMWERLLFLVALPFMFVACVVLVGVSVIGEALGLMKYPREDSTV